NTFTSSEGRKRKLIEIENNENNRQPLNLPYDLYESERQFIIVIDTPSVKNKGEISISVRKDRIVNIKGHISRDTIPGKQLESQNPLLFRKFDIKVNLPKNIDSEESTNVIVEAVSGDGIIHEIINGLLSRDDAFEIDIPIGTIPAGSGNALSICLLGNDHGVNASHATVNVIKGRVVFKVN
ncbi:10907_t:CDS:2, partial [Funneliformis geosporum]